MNGFEEFDIPKELIPKEQRLKCNNTLMNFVVDSIFTAQLFPILMERFTFEGIIVANVKMHRLYFRRNVEHSLLQCEVVFC